MTGAAHILRILALLLGLSAGAASWMALVSIAQGLAPVVRLDTLTLRPDDRAPVIVGHDALAQGEYGSAAAHHLALVRDGKAVQAFDITPDRRVGYYDKDTNGYHITGRLAVPKGASILNIGDVSWDVQSTGNRVVLVAEDIDVQITLSGRGATYQASDEVLSTAISVWDWGQSWLRGPSMRFRLGGSVAPERLETAIQNGTLADPRLPMQAASLILTDDGWSVQSGRLPVAILADGQHQDAEARPIQLVDDSGALLINRLILGRTVYGVSLGANRTLVLQPLKRHVWLPPDEVAPLTDVRITRTITQPQARLTPRALRRATGVALGLAGVLLVLTSVSGPNIGRAPALAVMGLALTLSPLPEAATIVGAAALGFVTVALLSAILTPTKRIAWNLALILLGVVLAGLALALPPAPGLNRPPPLELKLAGAWLALLAPFMSPRLNASGTMFWALLTALATFGTVASARLVSLEPTQAWSDLLDNHLIALAAIGFLAGVTLDISRSNLWPSAVARRLLLPRRPNPYVLAVTGMAGVGFAVVTLLGDETGFRGLFQPSEFAKSLLAILVASTVSLDLARRQMLTAHEGGLSLMPPIVAAGIALAIGAASALNYDMSPILVCAVATLAALTAGTALHMTQWLRCRYRRSRDGLPIPRPARSWFGPGSWRQSARLRARWSSFWPVAAFVLLWCVLIGIGSWVAMSKSFAPGAAFDAPSFLVTPWKRVQSHADMTVAPTGDHFIDFPEAGTQLKLGRIALLSAPCRLNLDTLCPTLRPASDAPEQALLRVPAVQDDFAAVSLVHALGVDGAVLFSAAQLALIAMALSIGATALLAPSDFRIGAWLVGCGTIGLGALVAAQIGVAWGNALGLLPIMGQPMTFVSLGASHHLGVALPFAVVTLLASQATRQQRITEPGTLYQIHKRRLLT